MEACEICKRIELIKKGINPYFVKELKTGYVVLGDHQFYRGYTIFLCKTHVPELHELEHDFMMQFLEEMAKTAKAVWNAFHPVKLNYELLGNTDRHLHWHIFPRYKDDPKPKLPVWVIPHDIRHADSQKPTSVQLQELKTALIKYL